MVEGRGGSEKSLYRCLSEVRVSVIFILVLDLECQESLIIQLNNKERNRFQGLKMKYKH